MKRCAAGVIVNPCIGSLELMHTQGAAQSLEVVKAKRRAHLALVTD